MYAVVRTGGKQYTVRPGDKLNVEKLDAEVGAKVKLEAICIVDGAKVEADPVKAAKTEVTAVVLEQFKGEKVQVVKFKKRKNYKRKNGHRQLLTRIAIESVGTEKVEIAKPEKKAAKPADKPAEKKAEVKPEAKKQSAPKAEAKPAEKKAAPKKEAAADLTKMTVAELKAMAAEKGVTIPSGAKKADIIDLLK